MRNRGEETERAMEDLRDVLLQNTFCIANEAKDGERDNRRRWRTLIKIHKEAQLKDRKTKSEKEERERRKDGKTKCVMASLCFIYFLSLWGSNVN